MKRYLALAAIGMALSMIAAHAQQSTPTKVQQQLEEMKSQQSIDRLRETRKNLQSAIEKLESTGGAPSPTTGVTPQGAALLQAEQALLDVRRAIDELDVPQDQRQTVLDKLDDADSALRMARQPEAQGERQRLRAALEQVHKEIEVAQETLPAPSSTER
jgi:hypothetical protein